MQKQVADALGVKVDELGNRVMNRMEINTIVNFALLILLWCVGVLAYLIIAAVFIFLILALFGMFNEIFKN